MRLSPENIGAFQEKLAEVRTKQANERTLLAYMRTALTLVVAGLSFVRFFDNRIIEIIGWVFIPFGVITVVLGIIRYINIKRHLKAHDI
ncbi:MAG: DUF202 domain-containing protein [Candidatus Zixiibacteriota bacterium]|nr:MAG: DUF202 domain-containing protein [candidate division Zixibacteria bacterium]